MHPLRLQIELKGKLSNSVLEFFRIFVQNKYILILRNSFSQYSLRICKNCSINLMVFIDDSQIIKYLTKNNSDEVYNYYRSIEKYTIKTDNL